MYNIRNVEFVIIIFIVGIFYPLLFTSSSSSSFSSIQLAWQFSLDPSKMFMCHHFILMGLGLPLFLRKFISDTLYPVMIGMTLQFKRNVELFMQEGTCFLETLRFVQLRLRNGCSPHTVHPFIVVLCGVILIRHHFKTYKLRITMFLDCHEPSLPM